MMTRKLSLPERIAELKAKGDEWPGEKSLELLDDLIPAYEALLPAMESLRAENERLEKELKNAKEDHLDFLGFMRDDLSHLPCCHEDGGHHGTPPMMWPELIRCIITKDRRDREAKLQDELKTARELLQIQSTLIHSMTNS